MKIQLINSPPLVPQKGGGISSIYPPLGLLYLASYVRQHYPDIEWKISDGVLNGYKKTVEEFNQFKPDIVGISFTTPFATGAYKFIDLIKEYNPEVLVVCGGVHASAIPNEILKRSKADIVVVGEGEKSFLDIVSRYAKGKISEDIGKIIYSPQIENIDTIPFPARDLIYIKQYSGYHLREKSPETDIISSRGCPYNCHYCSNPVWRVEKPSSKYPWCRLRSPQNYVDEIQFLYEKYGIREFFDECDEFNVNLNWSIQVCKEIISRNIDIKWKVQLRVGHVSEELVKLMAKSGCWLVFLGIESGNSETLKGINKKISIEQIQQTCELFKKYGIKIFGLLMTFNVWEMEDKLCYEGVNESLNTLRFAKSLMNNNLLDYLSCTITTPFPASSLWDTCMKYHLIPEENYGKWELWDTNWNLIMKLPNISEKDWIDIRYKGIKLQASAGLRNPGQLNFRTAKLFMERCLKALEFRRRYRAKK
ncbi:MAG: B12-binding domain-containing radical SAM protein [Candidatus Methanoperedens sp.]|nr:B12-binding domain-containing radical SAM protein [Candidatus Methanoperedens sp.]